MVSMATHDQSTRRNKQTLGQGRTQEFPRLLGGRLCMHFVNTVEGRLGEHPVDFLTSYAALARWSFHVELLDEPDVERLLEHAETRPREAERIGKQALRLRRAIDNVFRTIARNATPDEVELAIVRQHYAEALVHARLTPHGTAYDWDWEHYTDQLARPLWAVAKSAIDVLTTGELRRIRECPGTGTCGWLFYDTSKNGTRRWCSMEGCGSKVKTRRHYSRSRSR